MGIHPHTLEPNWSRTVRFQRGYLPRTLRLWNELPAEMFPRDYSMGFFKKGVKSFYKVGNAQMMLLVTHASIGCGDCLTLGRQAVRLFVTLFVSNTIALMFLRFVSFQTSHSKLLNKLR